MTEVKLPKELEQYNVLETYFNPEKSDVGILVLGQDLHPVSTKPVIRLYLLQQEGDEAIVKQELEAFAFESYGSAHSFLKKLPKMTAIEMLIMLRAE